MHVRPAIASDSASIRRVHLDAFPTSLEADLADRLVADDDAVLSMVAEEDGEVIGHVLFSRMDAEGDGQSIDALGLAPIAVRPEHQKRGIGAALISNGIAAAREAGAELLFVLGDPAYYGRFGFSLDAAAPFASPYAGPYLQAAFLSSLPAPRQGRAEYAPAFRNLAEADDA